MHNYGLLISIIIFVVFLLIIIWGHNQPTYKAYKQATGEVINHDSFMRKFVYQTKLDEERIIRSLCMRNAADELVCEIDEAAKIIKFVEYGDYREYYYRITRQEGYSVLELEQVSVIGMQSRIPFKLNPFIVVKLDAELIPYKE